MFAGASKILNRPYPPPLDLEPCVTAEILRDSLLGESSWPSQEFEKFRSSLRSIPANSRWDENTKAQTHRRLFPSYSECPSPLIAEFTTLYITERIDDQNDLRGRIMDGHQQGIMRQVLAYRLMQEIAGEIAFLKSGLAVFKPISEKPETEWQPYPFMDCQNFLLAQWLSPQQMRRISEVTGYSLYYIRYKAMNLIDRILLDHFRSVERAEPLQPHDAILYSADSDFFVQHGAHHFARVVAVEGHDVWVESKWGNLDRPCLHHIEDVPTESYGDHYLVARLNDASLLPTSELTIAEAGYSAVGQGIVAEAAIAGAAERHYQALMGLRLPDFYEQF